jgi:hypothetical protein
MKPILFILFIEIVLMSPTIGMGYQNTGLADGKLKPSSPTKLSCLSHLEACPGLRQKIGF